SSFSGTKRQRATSRARVGWRKHCGLTESRSRSLIFPLTPRGPSARLKIDSTGRRACRNLYALKPRHVRKTMAHYANVQGFILLPKLPPLLIDLPVPRIGQPRGLPKNSESLWPVSH